MLAVHVRLIQARLKALGHYHDRIDGERGPRTNAAARAAFATMPGPLPEGWQGWSDKRVTVGFLQLWARAEGIDAGVIDGWWGPQTDFAAGELIRLQQGVPVATAAPAAAPNPNRWPRESGVTGFYGPHGVPDRPPPPTLVKVPSPWTFRLAWNLNQTRSFLWAHERTADSLAAILARIHARYSEAEIRRLRLDIFSGDYAPRLKRGSRTQWSMHSWGIAYDFDDTRNRLNWGANQAALARPEYRDFWEIWEAEGWVSLGRAKNYDWMHVQAARLG